MEMLKEMSETVKNGLKISLVFGEPIETQGKTIIPVSKVAGGFGGGSGESPNIPCNTDEDDCAKENKAHGQGGGGGLHNEALGVFEITAVDTRFIPALQFKHILIMAAMTFAFILRISRRRRR